jgi:adenosine deaminase
MHVPPIHPLDAMVVDAQIARLPKVDLHIHQEWSPRLDRVLARRTGHLAYDWRSWVEQLMATTPPGMPRLRQLATIQPASKAADSATEHVIARLEDLFREAAQDGAVLVEVRLGNDTIVRPDCLSAFHEAERRVQQHYPQFHAEALAIIRPWHEPQRRERLVHACLRAAAEGLRGLDFLYEPYDTEADWTPIYHMAERATAVGLGITAHAGEFSRANLQAAVRTPGLTRLGHAVHAARHPDVLEQLAQRGITVECCLSSNVVLGAVETYAMHPIQQFRAAGVPVVLGTDDPVQVCTTIGREYAIAHTLGLGVADLLAMTRTAIDVAFTTVERRTQLHTAVIAWSATN